MRPCILIPTYNESRAIGKLVAAIRKEGFDVLVVDDGSLDETGRISRDSGAVVIRHEENRGKGASLKSGFAYAIENGYDSVLIMDGDGQHDPKDIRRFVEAHETTGADIIIGNRMENTKKMPFIRYATNRWMSSFISRLSGQKIPDTQCGYRLITTSILKKLDLKTEKFETESEILIRAGRQGYMIVSLPIKTIYKGEVSSINPFVDSLRFIRLILKMKLEKIF